MDRCPGLKICLAHSAGYRCFGIGRMDRGWQLRCEVRMPIEKPPRAFLLKFYEDYQTQSAAALRFLIVSVGTDRVVLGSDWRAATRIDWPVAWVLSLKSLTQEEKELILSKNLEQLPGL